VRSKASGGRVVLPDAEDGIHRSRAQVANFFVEREGGHPTYCACVGECACSHAGSVGPGGWVMDHQVNIVAVLGFFS
jgi:hypothetical protein